MPRSRRGDPTIPRKAAPAGNAKQRVSAAPTWGWFVDYGGGTLVLADSHGNSWPAERARVQQGTFGFDEEGVAKAPRAWKYVGDTAVIRGDTFLIVFLDNNPKLPVCIGGWGSLDPTDTDFRPVPMIGADPNPGTVRMLARSAAGTATGHVQVKALNGGARFEVEVGGGSFGTGLRIAIDHGAGTVDITAGGTTEKSPKGETLMDTVKALAMAIDQVNLAIPGGLALPSVTADMLAVVADCDASKLNGAPLLSSILKVE